MSGAQLPLLLRRRPPRLRAASLFSLPFQSLILSPPLLSHFPSSISSFAADRLLAAVFTLARDLLAAPDPSDPAPILESRSAASLLRLSPDGSASLRLFSLLKPRPLLALQVFSWRRKLAEPPLLPEEYAAVIALAGRARNLALATDFFTEATAVSSNACHYEALMAAYMYNGHIRKAIAVFDELQQDPQLRPTIITYNTLLSLYGHHTLVVKMESILHALDESGIPRTLVTYNVVIAGYLISKMWDRMEMTFRSMEERGMKPDVSTRLLMLRGYAVAGDLQKMESMYELVQETVNSKESGLIRVMVCAYCKSKNSDRIQKIEELMKLLEEEDYLPWLHVLLIRVYAQEGLIEAMERLISKAFLQNIVVTTVGVVRSIVATYFRCNKVDRMAWFIRRAEDAGWRLCPDSYQCKMVLYSQQNRLVEMHGAVDEMERCWPGRNRRTLLIMFKAYSNAGRRIEAEVVLGMMWKLGFELPRDALIT